MTNTYIEVPELPNHEHMVGPPKEYTCKGECGTLRPSFFLTQKLPGTILKNGQKYRLFKVQKLYHDYRTHRH